MNIVIILGSSRADGETAEVVKQIRHISNWDLIDLNDYKIGYYDYDHKNKEDDCLALVSKIIHNYDVLVFATPVYWYAMSGTMKTFFDRKAHFVTKNDEKENISQFVKKIDQLTQVTYRTEQL